MDFLEQLIGSNPDVTTRAVTAFGGALVLIIAVALVVWLLPRGRTRGSRRRGVRRLAIVEAVPIDRNRGLVLMRRDNVEHLVLIGGRTDVVVEQGILRGERRLLDTPALQERAATEVSSKQQRRVRAPSEMPNDLDVQAAE